MKLNVAVCEDERAQADYLKAAVAEWARKNRHICDIMTFPSAEAFLSLYEGDNIFDILLLDVEMAPGNINGIGLAKRIRKNDRRAEIIFITSHTEFMGYGYDVDALHYLIKPVSPEKLGGVLDKAAEKLSSEPLSVIFVSDGETVKLYETDILYIEAFLHYITIHTLKGEYRIKESLSSFQDKLSDLFFRVHRSYLVSLIHITRISRTCVSVGEKTEIPLSRGLYDSVNRAFIQKN